MRPAQRRGRACHPCAGMAWRPSMHHESSTAAHTPCKQAVQGARGQAGPLECALVPRVASFVCHAPPTLHAGDAPATSARSIVETMRICALLPHTFDQCEAPEAMNRRRSAPAAARPAGGRRHEGGEGGTGAMLTDDSLNAGYACALQKAPSTAPEPLSSTACPPPTSGGRLGSPLPDIGHPARVIGHWPSQPAHPSSRRARAPDRSLPLAMDAAPAKPKGRRRPPKKAEGAAAAAGGRADAGAPAAAAARPTATEATATEQTEHDDAAQPQPTLSQRLAKSLKQLSQLGAGSKTEVRRHRRRAADGRRGWRRMRADEGAPLRQPAVPPASGPSCST